MLRRVTWEKIVYLEKVKQILIVHDHEVDRLPSKLDTKQF